MAFFNFFFGVQFVDLKITKIWQYLDMKDEKIKCLVVLARESNEHSNTFDTNSSKSIYYPEFCCQDAAATGVPHGLSGQGQAGRTNPIIPARSRASRSPGGSSISGYQAPLWRWAKAESQREFGLVGPLARH